MHDDAGRADAAFGCRDRALSCYLAALAEPEAFRRRQDQAVVAYLSGELARRLGQEERAGSQFGLALSLCAGLDTMGDFAKVVRDQMDSPSDIIEGR
jgi:hypothetical protein